MFDTVMDRFSPPVYHRPSRRRAILAWLILALVLMGPSLLVWTVRGMGYGLGCRPGPQACTSLPLGFGFRLTLDLAWTLAFDAGLLILGAIAAAIAALWARRPVLAFASALGMPLAALVLPALAVFSSTYKGCAANEGGVGDCTLWGAPMGAAFHNAALAQWQLYIVAPYCFAAAVMLGLAGVIFFRER